MAGMIKPKHKQMMSPFMKVKSKAPGASRVKEDNQEENDQSKYIKQSQTNQKMTKSKIL